MSRFVAFALIPALLLAGCMGDDENDEDRERAIAEAMARRAPALGAERLHRIVHAIISESLGSLDAST